MSAGRRARLALALAIPCALFLGVSLAMSLRTPALSNNDEGDHIEYALYLRAHHALPAISIQNGDESHQPPLYYATLAVWTKLIGLPQFTPSLPPEPTTAANLDGFDHVYTTNAERQMATDVHLLRLPGIGYGLVTVLATFGSAWLLTRRLSVSSAVASTVSLWPKFDVVAGAVTNETLNYALSALAVLALLMWLRAERSAARWAGAVGLLSGLAVITELTSLPVAGLLLLFVMLRAAGRREWREPLVALAAFLAVSAWWFVRNTMVYGDPLALTATRTYLAHALPPLICPCGSGWGWSAAAHQLVNSVWYDGGANQLTLPGDLALAVTALAVACLVRGAWVIWRQWHLGRPYQQGLLVLLLAGAGAVMAWLAIASETSQAEGRYLLVAITAWSILLVAGTDRFEIMGRWASHALPWVWPALFAGLDVVVFARYLIPHGGW